MNTSKTPSLWRVLALSFVIAGLSACNTMEGAGKDIEAAGDAIEDEADEHNRYGDGDD